MSQQQFCPKSENRKNLFFLQCLTLTVVKKNYIGFELKIKLKQTFLLHNFSIQLQFWLKLYFTICLNVSLCDLINIKNIDLEHQKGTNGTSCPKSVHVCEIFPHEILHTLLFSCLFHLCPVDGASSCTVQCKRHDGAVMQYL